MPIVQTPSKRFLSQLTKARKQQRPSNPQHLDPVGVVLVMFSAFGFGTLAIFGKLAYAQGLDPLNTLSWRLGGAAVALWLWLGRRNQWRVNTVRLSPKRGKLAADPIKDAAIHAAERDVPDFS